MTRIVIISKAKAARKGCTQRQTRARAKFTRAAPLMTGLDHRGRATEELPKTPVTMAYAIAYKLDLQDRVRLAVIDQARQEAEERTKGNVQVNMQVDQQNSKKEIQVEARDTSSHHSSEEKDDNDNHRSSPPGYVPDSPETPKASDVLMSRNAGHGDNKDDKETINPEDKENNDGVPAEAHVQLSPGRLLMVRRPSLAPLQLVVTELDGSVGKDTSTPVEQHQTGFSQLLSLSKSPPAEALIHAYETDIAEKFPTMSPRPFPAVMAEMLAQFTKSGVPADCYCDGPGLCKDCEFEWESIADFKRAWTPHATSLKRKRRSDGPAVESPQRTVKRVALADIGSHSDKTLSIGTAEHLEKVSPHTDSACTGTLETPPATPATQPEVDSSRTSPTTSSFNNSSGHSIVPNPAEPLPERRRLDGLFGSDECPAPEGSRPGRGMNIYFWPKKPVEYAPDHDRQDTYDPTKPQPIDIKPIPTEYQPDHSDDGEEYDPAETRRFAAVQASPEYQTIGLKGVGPITPDINCVGCRLHHASTGETDTVCFDCKTDINHRLSYDDRRDWKKICIADAALGSHHQIEAACATAQNPRVVDLEGPDAGCWDARYDKEEGTQARSPSDDEEDYTDWEVEEAGY